MTLPRENIPIESTMSPSRLGRNDPLLQKLWAAKAELNASENYRVDSLAAKAASFDIDAAIDRLSKKSNH
ncbi:MAG TPA: hypothetical protein VJ001_04885 [Rhodocyclaceae bacterium]|nr:hypothetical protein [Rhodocyclaceae bacterium]